MASTYLCNYNAYKQLKTETGKFDTDTYHLKNLIQDPERFENFSTQMDGFFYDYSKQRIDKSVFELLIDLSKETEAKHKFSQMASGSIVNVTENRAALHTAMRDSSPTPILLNSPDIKSDIKPDITQVNQNIKEFTDKIHNKTLKGSTGKAFTDAVVIGIGGSYLGCEFVFSTLKNSFDPIINIHFLPNVDIDNFGRVIREINPETCLWIVISKSYTTTETMANLGQALLFLKEQQLDPAEHLVTVTAKGSPGDDPSNPVLASFYMFDFIGGRYSVTSAVGGVPLSLAFGYEVFERFLNGCNQMDVHTLNEPEEKNLPLISALISIWNSNFLDYTAQAIIPYCSALSELAPHIQQLYMESIGKGATIDGQLTDYRTGLIIFGEPGTNAQHSFFQLAHQGSPFPVEFIGVVRPVYNKVQAISKGVDNHQELWANMLAQAKALATGKESQDKARYFSGNRPSSTIIINDLSPESIGLLLSFYEARTAYEGFILGINPFDQFGVELGKVLAAEIRKEMVQKNTNPDHIFSSSDRATQFYLDTLFKGTI
jgi:glucose-6-phosphate isomerase